VLQNVAVGEVHIVDAFVEAALFFGESYLGFERRLEVVEQRVLDLDIAAQESVQKGFDCDFFGTSEQERIQVDAIERLFGFAEKIWKSWHRNIVVYGGRAKDGLNDFGDGFIAVLKLKFSV
jgi:hypothetical protein